MKTSGLSLPYPDRIVQGYSQALIKKIKNDIDLHNHSIPFDRFMQHCLYDPNLGYYSLAEPIFGQQGDFITAPVISSVFSACLANQCAHLMRVFGWQYILELGAGDGTMAVDILSQLKILNSLPEKYFIYEQSKKLKNIQQEVIRQATDFYDSVVWLDELPTQEKISGIVIGNEILDALPFKRAIIRDNKIFELKVSHEREKFIWTTEEATEELYEFFQCYHHCKTVSSGKKDIPIQIPHYLRLIMKNLEQGVIFFIDYGYDRKSNHEYIQHQPDLICHYKHHAHYDPFIYPGLQDISIAIDFILLNKIAKHIGLNLLGYTTQLHFLLDNGLEDIYSRFISSGKYDPVLLAQQIKLLTMPDEMGERFKVIAFSKSANVDIKGFDSKNLAARLSV